MNDPRVVSRDEWLAARRELLAEEKEFTRRRDALNAGRRTLPMVEIDKEYIFRGPDGQAGLHDLFTGELHGISAFLRRGDRVFHTYSSYARGTDMVNSAYQWLDLTARGRQEDWEQPSGRSDAPLLGWLRHHDRYGA
jgi:predicted dithiol-disulfide oxidoreductase (DUF899 family)